MPAAQRNENQEQEAPERALITAQDDGTAKAGATLGGAASKLSAYALLGAAAALFLLFTILEPSLFPTSGNITAMLSSQSLQLLLALAVVVPLRSGNFDLSIAAVMVFVSTLVAILITKTGLPVGAAMILGMLAGIAIGVVNGALVVYVGLNAFVVTLGTMTVLQGASIGLSGGNLISGMPSTVTSLARTEILNIPAAVFYGWALVLIMWYVFEYTPFGRYLLFVGGNAESARLAGLPTKAVHWGSFVIASAFSAFAGIVLLGKFGVADPSIGPEYLLPPYAAAFLGVTAVQPGRFNVWGTLIAVYLLIIVTTGLLLLGAQPWLTEVFNGLALLVAIIFARLARRQSRL